MTATAMKRIDHESPMTVGPRVATGDNALANLTDSDRFTQLQRVAKMMGSSALTPQHLKGKTPEETTANCFRVVNQAMRWGFDPFAVGDETYVVKGKLGYQGKLVAAVINSRAGLDGRLKASYKGAGDQRTVTITGQFDSEDEPRVIDLTVAQAKTDNAMWIKDPDQKLFYSGVTKWARRHCPELILGVMTVEDLEGIGSRREEEIEATKSLDAEILAAAPAGDKSKTTLDVAGGEVPNENAEPSGQVGENADQVAMDIQDAIDGARNMKEIEAAGAMLKANKAIIGNVRHDSLTLMLQSAARELEAKK